MPFFQGQGFQALDAFEQTDRFFEVSPQHLTLVRSRELAFLTAFQIDLPQLFIDLPGQGIIPVGIWGQDKIIKYFCDEWLLQNKRIYRVEFTPNLPWKGPSPNLPSSPALNLASSKSLAPLLTSRAPKTSPPGTSRRPLNTAVWTGPCLKSTKTIWNN